MAFERLRRLPITRSAFPWQALLVVPPVVILSVVALASLRQDRASIDRDARQSAATLAADLGREIGQRSGAALARWLVELDAPVTSARAQAGELPGVGIVVRGIIREPLDVPAAPVPPEWLRTLPLSERRALAKVEAALYRGRDDAAVAGAISALLAQDPLAPLRAYAEWVRLQREASAAQGVTTAGRLLEYATRYPEAVSTTGTPLADLALLLALRRLPTGDLPGPYRIELAFRAREHPSLLTSELIAEARRVAATGPSSDAVAAIAARHDTAVRTLAVMRATLARPPAPDSREAWLDVDGRPVLVLERPMRPDVGAGTGRIADWRYVVALPLPALDRIVASAVNELASRVPGYARVSLSIADRTITGPAQLPVLGSAAGALDAPAVVGRRIRNRLGYEFTGLVPGLDAAPPLASGAIRLRVGGSPHLFAVTVHLADPDALYARYHQRWRWSVGLVLAATAAALLGFASTWRAFRRQTALAEMKSNFVASVSHEFRAPVASVRLMAESLERGAVRDEARGREYVRLIVQECRRLSSLVENVLDFSRIDQGRKRYTMEPTDLMALVRHAVGLLEPYAAQRSVSIECIAPPAVSDPVQPVCDQQAIQQALVNLIDNAVKHSPPGSTVRVTVDSPDDLRVALSVEDQGPGIPREDQVRIFEPFYRRGSELRRETQGVGIGLAIVRHVADAHGGAVHVDSEVGRGSRFTLEFPTSPPGAGSRSTPTPGGIS